MKQLNPIDSFFVYNEKPNSPMHISPLMCSDVSTAPGSFVRFKDILEAKHDLPSASLVAGVPVSIRAPGEAPSGGNQVSGMRIHLRTTVVTNVPGPQVSLFMCGARMVWWFGAGALADGLGLFHTVTSYDGQIAVAYLSCRQLMPDPEVYDRCIREAFEELEAAAADRWQPKPRSWAGAASGAR